MADQLFFGNMLTHYLRKEEVDEELEFDIIIPAALRGTDITSVRAKEDDDGSVLTGSENQALDDNCMAHFHVMPDLATANWWEASYFLGASTLE